MSQTKNEISANSRRLFLKGALSTAVVATAMSAGNAIASNHISMTGIVYTKENPGKWAKKVGSHLPSINIDGNKVTIKTDHGMSKKHFIVRHTLVSEQGEVLGEKTFSADDEAISSFQLAANYKGKIYATSFCNKHDFWLAETII